MAITLGEKQNAKRIAAKLKGKKAYEQYLDKMFDRGQLTREEYYDYAKKQRTLHSMPDMSVEEFNSGEFNYWYKKYLKNHCRRRNNENKP